MKPALQVHIQHRFPTGFSLDIQLETQSESIGLSGPSGSGKTSVMHAIAGIFQPQYAQIQFQDQCFAREQFWLAPRNRKVGLVTQDALLYPHLSVGENLGFSVSAQAPIEANHRVVQMLEIDHIVDRRVRHLSGGERQRVALGRALIAQPSILLADEPFCAVDLQRRARIVERLKNHLSSTSTSLLLVSHDQTVIDDLCSLQVEMTHGQLHHND